MNSDDEDLTINFGLTSIRDYFKLFSLLSTLFSQLIDFLIFSSSSFNQYLNIIELLLITINYLIKLSTFHEEKFSKC